MKNDGRSWLKTRKRQISNQKKQPLNEIQSALAMIDKESTKDSDSAPSLQESELPFRTR